MKTWCSLYATQHKCWWNKNIIIQILANMVDLNKSIWKSEITAKIRESYVENKYKLYQTLPNISF